MPLIEESTYRPPPFLRSGHVQTLFAALFRPAPPVTCVPVEIPSADGSALNAEQTWEPGRPRSEKLAILTHGLEGSSRQPYIQGMARKLHAAGWDVAAWDFRGCGVRAKDADVLGYHSGATGDLGTVVDHYLGSRADAELSLVGFSMGGNITLKYLGDLGADADPRVTKAVAFSTPCHLENCADQLARPSNRLYMWRFLRSLSRKAAAVEERVPGTLDVHAVSEMRTFHEFDEHVTARIHGFASAKDYWTRCSSANVLHQIRRPTLLVNARDDPMLADGCYPEETAKDSAHFFFEAPASGGHVGFVTLGRNGTYWSEERAHRFLESGI